MTTSFPQVTTDETCAATKAETERIQKHGDFRLGATARREHLGLDLPDVRVPATVLAAVAGRVRAWDYPVLAAVLALSSAAISAH